MSSRPVFPPYQVITSGAMSGNLTSKVTILTNLSMLSYGLSWAGTAPVGAVSVEVSNDYSTNSDGSVKNAGTWNTLTLTVSSLPTTSVPISGNTGNGFIDVDITAAYAIRLIYTRSSGTGALTVTACGKVA